MREQAWMVPIVFLPGANGRTAFWRPVAERLADLGPATLVGYPGFGDAPRDPSVRSVDDLYRWLLPRLPPGPFALVAQSMGGVLGSRLAIELPERVTHLVLTATSGGVDVARLGGSDWRAGFRAARPEVPDWFELDRTDLTDRLGSIRAPTLLLWSDVDPSARSPSPTCCWRASPARAGRSSPGARTRSPRSGPTRSPR